MGNRQREMEEEHHKKRVKDNSRENTGPIFGSFDEGDASESSSCSHPWCRVTTEGLATAGSLEFIYTVCVCVCVRVCTYVSGDLKQAWNSVLWTAQQQNVTFPDNVIQPCRSHSSLFTQLYFSWLKSSNEPRPINNGSPKRKKNNLAKVWSVCLCFIRLRRFALCLIVFCSAPFNCILLHPISFYPIW